MVCRVIKGENGEIIIACSRGKRAQVCEDCKSRSATIRCDFELRGALKGKTCDRWLCSKCATEVGVDRHLCRAHLKLAEPEEIGDREDGAGNRY